MSAIDKISINQRNIQWVLVVLWYQKNRPDGGLSGRDSEELEDIEVVLGEKIQDDHVRNWSTSVESVSATSRAVW